MSKGEYPEHEKLAKVSDESQAQGEFIEWLQTRGFWLCEMWEGKFHLIQNSITNLLAEYHQIDTKKIEDEKRAMLAELRFRKVK